MPFGPTNAPTFYTAMMKDFKDEWDNLFVIRVATLQTIDGMVVVVINATTLRIDDRVLVWGSKLIIDDILLWYDNKTLLFLYFLCVCEIFKKYSLACPLLYLTKVPH